MDGSMQASGGRRVAAVVAVLMGVAAGMPGTAAGQEGGTALAAATSPADVGAGAIGSARAATKASLAIRVSVSRGKLEVLKDGEVAESFVVSVGTRRYPTPRGTFAIRKVVWNPAWVPPDAAWARAKKPRQPGHPQNPMQVAKLFFREPDYYIHGTPKIHELGEPASHGCIRMHPADVETLGRWVMEHGGAGYGDDWVDRVLLTNRSHVVQLKSPVSITVTS